MYLYVGKNQRMAGEAKKLGKPFAIVRKKRKSIEDEEVTVRDTYLTDADALEVVEIVKFKITFPTRPEPVGKGMEGTF